MTTAPAHPHPNPKGQPMTEQPARTAVYSDLVWPAWNPVSEDHGLTVDQANARLDAHAAEVLLHAADAVQATRDPFPPGVWNGITWAVSELRRMAADLKHNDQVPF